MRILLFSALLFCLPSVHAQQAGADSLTSEFARVADRWVAIYNGGDASAFSVLYAPEAQYISGHVQGLVADGRDAVIANFQRGMKMGGHLDGLQVISVRRSCNLATVLCRYEANNAGQKATGRNLLVLEHRDGCWLIVLHMTVV